MLGTEPEIDLEEEEEKKKNGDLEDDHSRFSLYKYSCLLPTLAHVTAGH